MSVSFVEAMACQQARGESPQQPGLASEPAGSRHSRCWPLWPFAMHSPCMRQPFLDSIVGL